MTPLPSPALQITGLTLAYPDGSGRTTPILDQISLTIPTGAVTALLGLPGAGKTSLLRAASGRIPTQPGKVRISGLDLAASPIGASKAWLQGDPILSPELSSGNPEDFNNLLISLEIEPSALADPASLPSTVQDRARLVPLLLDPSPLLLIDEHPGLTLATAALLQTWLPDRAHARGQAVFLATQQPEVASLLCDRVAILQHGRLVYDGPLPNISSPLEGSSYRIRLGGRIDPHSAGWPPGLTVSSEGGDVLLAGELPDQAALYGVLARARDLGLTLLSIERAIPGMVDWLREKM
jgi:ABC-type multidrug transport system ATPase subunit